MLPLDGSLDSLMADSFNQVGDIFGGDFDDIGMDETSEDQNMVTIDSRLDVESVLIDLDDLENMGSRLAESSNNRPSVIKSESFDANVHPIIESESTVKQEDILETICPQQRDRCNTWPRQVQGGASSSSSSPTYSSNSPSQPLPSVTEDEAQEEEEDEFSTTSSMGSFKSKSNARRNPWGNSSYADLITMAIQSAPDRRLTLSQIYDWMVGAVPYFSDRADSSSSAGWKNSIRHNLSLHQKFLKIPNEGAGKSSWWTLNPENNTVKKPRRRATSGDVRNLQCKRDKAKKHVESLKMADRLVRSSSINRLPSLSPSFDSNSSNEMFRPRANSTTGYHDEAFSTFRSRNLSNASSTGPISPLNLDDLSSQSFPLLTDMKAESDLDNIALDDLNLQSESLSLDPATVLLDFLDSEKKQSHSAPAVPNKIKILEPREPQSGCFRNNAKQSQGDVLSNYNSDYYPPPMSYVTPLQTIDKHEHDEVRKPMIIKQLNQLTQKRSEILQDSANISVDNKRSIEDDFDLKIMLLQEELNKLTREEEMLKIHRYSSASNNPYFAVYNHQRPLYSSYPAQSFRRESSPEHPNPIAMDISESSFKSDIKSF